MFAVVLLCRSYIQMLNVCCSPDRVHMWTGNDWCINLPLYKIASERGLINELNWRDPKNEKGIRELAKERGLTNFMEEIAGSDWGSRWLFGDNVGHCHVHFPQNELQSMKATLKPENKSFLSSYKALCAVRE